MGIVSESEVLTLIKTRHPGSDRNAPIINIHFQEPNAAVIHTANYGTFPPKEWVNWVFNLDIALVAGIINIILASVATSTLWRA